MDTRTLGIEEELLVVDPESRTATSRAGAVLREHRRRDLPSSGEHGGEDGGEHGEPSPLDPELFRHQLETRSDPTTDVVRAVGQIVEARRRAGEAAAALGLAVAAGAASPLGLDEVVPAVTAEDRYRRIVDTYGDVARLGGTCGMHVHVAIESDEEGVGCLDRIAPWLPVLAAVSSNSPYADGRDTGYASWRTQAWSSWPSAGPTEAFGSVAGYEAVCERMIASGAALDRGMLYFDARLAEEHPTLEVRVLDATTDPDDIALLAALVRGLVETAALDVASHGVARNGWRCEELRAARWRASRSGLGDRLLDPVDHTVRPAREVLARLVDHVRERLDAAGDLELVETGVARVLAGTGAVHQRSARERGGSLEGVVDDLLARTAASWEGAWGGSLPPTDRPSLGSSDGPHEDGSDPMTGTTNGTAGAERGGRRG
ncbi:glutamate--cysteine ligase [Nocardioides flavescens]|uniref:Putative glutamate--cysteine ligase 2 n=1 Tax=Nocardioides flavescens TaxID=2691959 RepID=A0A6L7EXX8_9ACTN|nr:YbdK family carboxylate-amine ligase [Nocardioides flavescens]